MKNKKQFSKLLLICFTPIFIFVFVSMVYAEGSDDIGLNQALRSETVLFVDIIYPSTETFKWSGTGSVTVISPTDIEIGAFNSGDTISPLEVGAYRIELSQDQNGPWSIDVSDGGDQLSGRLHSTNWFLDQGSFLVDSAINSSYFALVPAGGNGFNTVIEMFFEGLAGFLYEISANQTGIDGTKAGMSVPVAGNSFTPSLPIYLNIPEIASFSVLNPNVSNYTATSFEPGGYSFSFDSNVEATYHIILDLNDDSIFNLVGDDVVLSGIASVGPNFITWNGLDAFGAPVPEGQYKSKLFLNVGELHFVARDIETIYPGHRLFTVNSDGSRSSLIMFWNDALVQSNFVIMPNGDIGSETSDSSGVFSGAYGDLTVAHSVATGTGTGNAHAWGNFGDSGFGKGNNAFIDTFSWVSGVASTVVTLDITAITPEPSIEASQLSFNFGEVILDFSSTDILEISNVGTAPLIVDNINFQTSSIDDFTIFIPNLPITINPNENPIQVEITYAPMVAGSASGIIEITSNDPINPQVLVTLSGIGVAEGPMNIDDLINLVQALNTSTASKNILINVLDNVQSALDRKEYRKVRKRLGKFINILISRSNFMNRNPNQIPLNEANGLIQSTVEVLVGIPLE